MKKLLEEERQAKININEESNQMVNAYIDNLHCRVNVLCMEVTDSFLVADYSVQAASDVPPAFAPEFQKRSGANGNDGNEFQCNTEPDFPEASPEHISTKFLHHHFAR